MTIEEQIINTLEDKLEIQKRYIKELEEIIRGLK